MAHRTVVPLFISSPGDCDQEKDAIKRAARAYNDVARTSSNLEVFAFDQRDLFSGAAAPGEYAQTVVNRQLEEYELYVGVWRERLGTPTPVASSGTMEELERALARLRRTRRPWIMAYFWAASPADFSAIKSTLRDHNAFYHTFNDPSDLESTFSRHLSGYLRDEYRLKGHSKTRLPSGSSEPALSTAHMTFDVHTDGAMQRHSFDRSSVAVGRLPERNDIVITNQTVHGQQGLFFYKDGIVFYIDQHGDSRFEPGKDAGVERTAYGHQTVNAGDAVVLPDGTRIVLRAAFS